MRKYLSILRLGWLDALEYRTEFFVSVIGWGIRLFIAIFLWLAVLGARNGQVGVYSLNTILGYFFIIQIISSFVFSRVGFDIAYDIYRGDFANFLVKPMNYIVFRMVREMSKNAFRTVLGILLFGSILFIFFGGIPLLWWKVPMVIAAIAGAYLVNFCLVCIIALSAFWITNATRLTFIYFGILTIFSGMIFPVDLFPPGLLRIAQALPFPYIFYFPAKIIQASKLDQMMLRGFLLQWFFVILLGALTYLTYRLGVKKFEAVGR